MDTCLSNASSDSGDEAENTALYKERIDNLIKQLGYYRKVIQQEKTRNDSLQSLTDSMKEIRMSSGEMQLELEKKDGIITVLQNRLSQLGASTELSLGDEEFIVLPPSREMFDRIVKENQRLTESLKYSSYDPNGFEKTLEQLRNLQMEHRELQKSHDKLLQEFQQQKSLVEKSDDDKVKEISALKERLDDSEKNTDLHSTLCQSLTDEKSELRKQLQVTIDRCQKLQRDLLLNATSGQSNESQSETEGKVSRVSEDINAQFKLLEKENKGLKAELHLLKQDRNKVLSHNKEWQNYNDERESHVIELQRQVTELTDRLAKSRAAQDTGFSDKQQEEVDKIVLQYKGKVEAAEQGKQAVDDENRQLRQDKLKMSRELESANKELHQLRQNMQAFTDQAEDVNKYKERISLLETQLKIFSDDFVNERQDRERATARVSDLERDLVFYKQFYERQQRHGVAGGGGGGSAMEEIALRRQEALNRYQQEYYRQTQQHQPYRNFPQHYTPHLVQPAGGGGRRLEADGEPDRAPLADEDVIDLPVFQQNIGPAPRAASEVNTSTTQKISDSAAEPHEKLRAADSRIRHANTTGDLSPRGLTTDYAPAHVQKPTNYFDQPTAKREGNYFASPRPTQDNTFDKGPSKKVDIADDDGNTLQCPKCQMNFRQDQHLDLLDHINDCC